VAGAPHSQQQGQSAAALLQPWAPVALGAAGTGSAAHSHTAPCAPWRAEDGRAFMQPLMGSGSNSFETAGLVSSIDLPTAMRPSAMHQGQLLLQQQQQLQLQQAQLQLQMQQELQLLEQQAQAQAQARLQQQQQQQQQMEAQLRQQAPFAPQTHVSQGALAGLLQGLKAKTAALLSGSRAPSAQTHHNHHHTLLPQHPSAPGSFSTPQPQGDPATPAAPPACAPQPAPAAETAAEPHKRRMLVFRRRADGGSAGSGRLSFSSQRMISSALERQQQHRAADGDADDDTDAAPTAPGAPGAPVAAAPAGAEPALSCSRSSSGATPPALHGGDVGAAAPAADEGSGLPPARPSAVRSHSANSASSGLAGGATRRAAQAGEKRAAGGGAAPAGIEQTSKKLHAARRDFPGQAPIGDDGAAAGAAQLPCIPEAAGSAGASRRRRGRPGPTAAFGGSLGSCSAPNNLLYSAPSLLMQAQPAAHQQAWNSAGSCIGAIDLWATPLGQDACGAGAGVGSFNWAPPGGVAAASQPVGWHSAGSCVSAAGDVIVAQAQAQAADAQWLQAVQLQRRQQQLLQLQHLQQLQAAQQGQLLSHAGVPFPGVLF
jgi:hypothetical protein